MNWVLMAALLLCSGLVSGAETAVFSLRPAERRALQRSSAWGARMLRRPTDLLVALLLTNLALNVGYFTVSSALSLELLAQQRGLAATAVGLGSLAAIVVLGEILPKSLALAAPAQLAGLLALPVVLLRTLLAPLVGLASWATRLLESLLLGSATRLEEPDANDYKSALSSGVALGAYRAVELALLHDVVDIGARRARSLMVPRVDVAFLSLQDDLAAWVATMAERPHTDYPVISGRRDDVVGTINAGVLLSRPDARREDLLDPPLFVPEGIGAERLVLRLADERRHLAILLDEYGGVTGVLGLADLSRAVLGEVEGLSTGGYRRGGGGGVLLPGSCSLMTLNEELGLELPARRSDTLAGALAEGLGRVPKVGDELLHGGWRLRVTAVRRQAVESVLARPARRSRPDGAPEPGGAP
ncbi:MAG: hypothetical protein DRQ55_01630 [Planctomycetota bacterium]|nr:MAG: hypothetical protein DRQ55_01630 [Planctomycetota bacterium]